MKRSEMRAEHMDEHIQQLESMELAGLATGCVKDIFCTTSEDMSKVLHLCVDDGGGFPEAPEEAHKRCGAGLADWTADRIRAAVSGLFSAKVAVAGVRLAHDTRLMRVLIAAGIALKNAKLPEKGQLLTIAEIDGLIMHTKVLMTTMQLDPDAIENEVEGTLFLATGLELRELGCAARPEKKEGAPTAKAQWEVA